jgi:hypothetical protein
LFLGGSSKMRLRIAEPIPIPFPFEKALRLMASRGTPNNPLHLTAAGLRFFRVQRLTSRRGR